MIYDAQAQYFFIARLGEREFHQNRSYLPIAFGHLLLNKHPGSLIVPEHLFQLRLEFL